MSDRPGDDLLVNYIRGHTQPVQWVGWWSAAAGTPAAESLCSALFEPGGEALRDLTAPAVREDVIRVVLASRALRRAVGAEAGRLLGAVAERLARGGVAEASPMAWGPFDGGSTIGATGSEGGVILWDEEHSLGSRITLEWGGATAPYAVTCGIHGSMFHTAWAASEAAGVAMYEGMRDRLVELLEAPTEDEYLAMLRRFVDDY